LVIAFFEAPVGSVRGDAIGRVTVGLKADTT
jgi:hypothetical protein